jgi:hypothetical protein
MPIHATSRYTQIEPGKNISHLTRVNSSSNSSKTIAPRKIIEGLDLRYDDDYLEWRMEMRGGRKVATVRPPSVILDIPISGFYDTRLPRSIGH